MWRKYFKVKNVVPGRIVTPRHGVIDLSRDDLSLETLRELFEEDWPYIEITPEGSDLLYGKPSLPVQDTELTAPVPDIAPDVTIPKETVPENPETVTIKAPVKKTPRKRVTK